ncbi:hypothetical protein MMARE11_01950 [Mycobacterium marinum E11]|nr:hypothetical protein MMARE11_01950 [Mycobacterium marinum E11]
MAVPGGWPDTARAGGWLQARGDQDRTHLTIER